MKAKLLDTTSHRTPFQPDSSQTPSFQTHGIERLALVTDAWHPQVNGVVTTLTQLVKQLRQQGIEVDVIHPNDYQTMPLPTYPEIPLVWRAKGLKQRLLDFQPDALHIATEGGLGWRARNLAVKYQWPFTTAYHTKYPEYIHERFPIPTSWVYHILRRFHRKAEKTLVPAPSILQELQSQDFGHVGLMSRGVDTETFHPQRADDLGYGQDVYLYVGRVAPEKNITAFLNLPLDGKKVVVGKGPDLERLKVTYPDVEFVGPKYGTELAAYYASAKVFVFPSLTDTFGVVNLEAIACGTPVAAYPVTGPKDIITQGVNGALHDDLGKAAQQAAQLNRTYIHDSIPEYTWQGATQQFVNQLAVIHHFRAQSETAKASTKSRPNLTSKTPQKALKTTRPGGF